MVAVDYIGRFFDLRVVGVAESVGVWVVIVESGVDELGAAIGSVGVVDGSVLGVAGLVVVGAGVPGVVEGVAGTVLVGALGVPGVGLVVCASAAVEKVKAAILVSVAIRMGSGPFKSVTIKWVEPNNASPIDQSLLLSRGHHHWPALAALAPMQQFMVRQY